MAIELLNKDHISAFRNSIQNSNSKIRIVSPFIGFETSRQLAESLNGTNVECTIITRFYREDFLNHVSSLEGLKILIEAGCKIYALKELHSKLYIFDMDVAILGSANFTMGGMKFNHELSLFIEEEDELINHLNYYYDELLDKIISDGDWCISEIQIEAEIKLLDTLSRNRKDKKTKYENTHRFGAKLTDKSVSVEQDLIEKILRESMESELAEGIWLKFVGTGNDRFDPSSHYSPERLKSNDKRVTSFPRNPRGIADADYIYLAAVSWDKNNVATPMIVARARSKGFDKNNIATEKDCNQYAWMNEYPYYVEIYDVEILNTNVSETISLDRLIRELGSDLYPTTQGKQLSTAQLKSRHYQKSHIRLTPTAKSYIDKVFDDLALNVGKNIL